MAWYTFMPKLFNMSLTASVAVVFVILLRLFLKKAPKVVSYALWGVVLFRLLFPVSVESGFSLYNLFDVPTEESGAMTSVIEYVPEDIVHTEYPSVALPVPGISDVINDALPQGREQMVADPLEAPTSFATYIWMTGVLVMAVYSIVSYIKLHGKLLASVKLRENIYIADDIASPFVMGLIRPKIYLPSSLPEKECGYILLHEQHHVRRGDHIVRLLAFAALCLHWFNPLVWIAFILSGKDMEMSCDEAVLRKLGEDIRADYTASLIRLATGRRIIAGTPLAFGEGETMGRVKNIARWKKPTVWVSVLAVLVCIMLSVCLITNPMNRDTMLFGAEYRVAETLYETPSQRSFFIDNDLPSFCITADFCLWERDADGEFVFIGQMEPYTLDLEELTQYTAYEEGWRKQYKIGDITDSYILHLPGGINEDWMYIAFRTNRGDTLLGFGREDISERGDPYSDDSGFMWLYRLESTFENIGQAGTFLDRSLAYTVGGDVDSFYTWSHADKPGYIIIGFESDDSAYSDGWQVPSPEKPDMGFAVFYHNKEKSGYRLLQCHVYEDAALAENGIYICPDPAVLDLDGEIKPDMTYDIVLVNNEAVNTITRHYSYTNGSERTISTPPISRKYMAVFSWEYYDKERGTSVQSVYNEQGEQICQNHIVKHGMPALVMVPTSADIRGAFDNYLYVPFGSVNYRYERIDDNPATVTWGEHIVGFTEEAEPKDVLWRIYAVKEYPDHSVVLAAGDNYFQLYRYSPPKAVDPTLLEQAKADGKIVLEDGYVTSGQAVWNTFYKMSSEGKPISAEIVHYHTLENGNYDETYYEVYREDYPAMYTFDLTYTEDTYTLTWNEYGTEYVRTYKYLMKYEDTLKTQFSSVKPQKVTRYVLTNDNTASWEELWRSLASSQLGDYIDHYTIYSEKNK